jgi:hypothetical protein
MLVGVDSSTRVAVDPLPPMPAEEPARTTEVVRRTLLDLLRHRS